MAIEPIAVPTEYCGPCDTVLTHNLHCAHCGTYPRIEDIRVRYACVSCKAELRDSPVCASCKTVHRWN